MKSKSKVYYFNNDKNPLTNETLEEQDLKN